jgi:hypothetical protein
MPAPTATGLSEPTQPVAGNGPTPWQDQRAGADRRPLRGVTAIRTTEARQMAVRLSPSASLGSTLCSRRRAQHAIRASGARADR